MNKLIKQQLENVSVTNIDFDDNSTYIFIPKTIKILNSSLKKGEYYVLKLYDSITHPAPSSTLASNWNGGVIPEYDMYIAEIIDNMGKMIKINGVANVNPKSNFYGWLPFDGFEVVSKL